MSRVERLGLLMLAVVFATASYGAWIVWPVAELALAADPRSASGAEAEPAERFAASLGTYTARFDGRYLFFEPPPPRPEPRPIVREEREDRPPPPPATYGGPRIVAMFADEVWFADGRRLRAGGDEDGSLRVLSLDCPWSAEIEWKGVTFTVSFFGRDKVIGTLEPAAAAAPPPDSAPADEPEPTSRAVTAGDPPATETQ